MTLTIEKASPATTIQDLGRREAQHIGFSQGGAADEQAYLWSNKLLANPANSAALEIVTGPFICTFEHNTRIAITGASNHIFLNGNRQSSWCSFNIKAGDQLRIPFPDSGLINYFAIKNGFSDPLHFQSRSMVLRESSGPDTRSAIKAGDSLSYTPFNTEDDPTTKMTPSRFIDNYQNDLQARVIIHPEHALAADYTRDFFDGSYTISSNSNKMAYRLNGKALDPDVHSSFLSRGTPLGTIQVPQDGQPIVLLKDRQTIGGYPQIGFVCQRDCFRLSQRRPGQQVRFTVAERSACQQELKGFYRFFGL